ncbi:uncharacterized protein I303_103242 [Kwoniella dejecticola CBS 10117]|uniref:Allantoate transporter n=1 Tax=Kwoniella dejecticola CBS 10117 TaxID=1296121 RepID=A0A1A6AB13_9TREE|nr:uncharacterized protein I303_03265 [Kwoniella dejecticola CBS 10117]OBR87240.1 hypothetical protein I303_03265 [Kwoniella dejecticola CBS 10117]
MTTNTTHHIAIERVTSLQEDEKAPEIEHAEEVHQSDAKGRNKKYEDDAADILRQVGDLEYTVDEDKRVLRKIDRWVLIPMFFTYTLVHLDKNALSYGAVFDLQKETHLVGNQYSWLSSLLYLVQLVIQPLAALALVRLPLAKWVAGNVFGWGVSVACMAAAKDFKTLMVCRALVGAFEAPISPTFMAVSQLWWRRREQTYRNTFWLLSSGFASLIGPLTAFGVGHIHTENLRPYQSIFIFLGCITVVIAPIILWAMPDDIKSARFLDLREKAIAVERLRANNTGTKTSHWEWYQCREAFMDPKTFLFGFMLLITAIPSSGISSFGGLITKGFGFTSFQAILFQIPMAALMVILTTAGTFTINKIRLRFPVIAVIILAPISGAVALIYVDRKKTGALLGAYYLVTIYNCIQPLLYSWANSNAAGTTKQRTIGGVLFVCQCAGNVIGPQVYFQREAPIYHTGLYVDIACWSLLCFLCLFMGFYLKMLNRRQSKKREERGGLANVMDTSIMTLEEADEYNKRLASEGIQVNQNAFADLTDFENPDFQYVL